VTRACNWWPTFHPARRAGPLSLYGRGASRVLKGRSFNDEGRRSRLRRVQEGSGFVVAPGLVVTNAHVVAGTRSIRVEDPIGYHAAVVELFDPEFDLAILRVEGLPEPALTIDPNTVGRATKAVVLGYPEGGPLTADRAGVRSQLLATGLDIYGREPVRARRCTWSRPWVRPGNSGGPLIEPDGVVIGVVFSRSPTSPTSVTPPSAFAGESSSALRKCEVVPRFAPCQASGTGRVCRRS